MAKKYEMIAQILREDLSGNSGFRIPTEMQLAQQFQCSRETVRHALRILAEEGRIQKIQGSGSFALPNGSNSDSSMQIAVISTFTDDYIFPRVLHDMKQVLSQRGYTLLPFSSENQVSMEREILTRLTELPLCGILSEGAKTALPSPNLSLYGQLSRKGIPIVFFQGGYDALTDIACVRDDNFGGGYMLGSHLLKCRHRTIGGIFKWDDIQGPQRYWGLARALENQVPLPDQQICWYDSQTRAQIINGNTSVLRKYLEGPGADCTAIVCYNDEIAYHLIRLLTEMRRNVPKDVAVVSFDRSYYGEISPVPITSLRHSEIRMGTVAAQLLLRSMHGEYVKSSSLPWVLDRRASG